MSFNEVLKRLRNDRGMTQEKLAEVLNIPSSTIRRLETDSEGIPRKERLEAIADYFKVSVDFLLGRQEISESKITDPQQLELYEAIEELDEDNKRFTLEFVKRLPKKQL